MYVLMHGRVQPSMQGRFCLAARELYDGHGFAAKLPNLIASKSV